MLNLVSVFIASAFAQAEAAAPSGQPSILESLFPFLLIFVIFFFLVIRPQAKKAKEHTGFLANLKKGDKILTSSGIYGTVEGLTDKFADISIADNVRIKVLKSQVAGYVKEVE